MYDIFVSYAREDRPRVEPMVKELLKLGWRVFIDRNILPGSNWSSAINKALEETCCVLVVWTAASVNLAAHPWVRDEAESGRQRNILVPLRLDVVEPPPGFDGIQTADLSNWNKDGTHPEFLHCVEAIRAIGNAGFKKIMDLLADPATIAEALILAKKLPFNGTNDVLFEQLRREFINKSPDLSDLVGRIRVFLSDYDPANTKHNEEQPVNHRGDDMTPWHHLDKQKMKQDFKRLWYKKTPVNVFIIERNPEAYSYHLHTILQTFCGREFDTVCSVKGAPSDHLDIAYAEDEFVRYMARYFDINVALMQNHEYVQSRILDTQVHFVVQSIDEFSYLNFRKYYELWVALEPREPLFLFFHVKRGTLAEDIEALENYCLCRYHDHEEVDGEAFQDFFSDTKSPLKNSNPDICNAAPMTFQKAVQELECCLKEQ